MEYPGTRLRRWREERELTLEQMAERCGIPSWTTLSHVETGRRHAGRRIANAIERATDGAIRSTDWDDWDDYEREHKPEPTGGEAA